MDRQTVIIAGLIVFSLLALYLWGRALLLMRRTPIDWIGSQQDFERSLVKERRLYLLGGASALIALIFALGVKVY